MSDSVCIIDFAGNARQAGHWCDWYPAEKVVRFGDYWCDVSDMPAKTEPTEEQCEAWAAKYADVSAAGFEAYLNNAAASERAGRMECLLVDTTTE